MRHSKSKIKALSDEALMASLSTKKGNEALSELYARYAHRVLGYFLRMFQGDSDKAQDFVQELFLKILEKHRQFDPSKKFYAWMFTIACNMCKTEFRNAHRTQSIEQQSVAIEPKDWSDDNHTKEVFQLKLQEALGALDELHRSVFVLRYFNHLTLKEIAEIKEIPLGTVKSRLFHATGKMAKELEAFKAQTNLFKLS